MAVEEVTVMPDGPISGEDAAGTRGPSRCPSGHRDGGRPDTGQFTDPAEETLPPGHDLSGGAPEGVWLTASSWLPADVLAALGDRGRDGGGAPRVAAAFCQGGPLDALAPGPVLGTFLAEAADITAAAAKADATSSSADTDAASCQPGPSGPSGPDSQAGAAGAVSETGAVDAVSETGASGGTATQRPSGPAPAESGPAGAGSAAGAPAAEEPAVPGSAAGG